MALLQCRECGHAVSEHADKCPNCGCPVSGGTVNTPQETRPAAAPPAKKGGVGKLIALLLVLVLVIGGIFYAIWFMKPNSDDQTKNESQTTEQTQDQNQEQTTENQSNETDDTEDYSEDEEYYEPAEDGGTEDDGAQGGQDVTDDNP